MKPDLAQDVENRVNSEDQKGDRKGEDHARPVAEDGHVPKDGALAFGGRLIRTFARDGLLLLRGLFRLVPETGSVQNRDARRKHEDGRDGKGNENVANPNGSNHPFRRVCQGDGKDDAEDDEKGEGNDEEDETRFAHPLGPDGREVLLSIDFLGLLLDLGIADEIGNARAEEKEE